MWLAGQESLKLRMKSGPGKNLGMSTVIMVTDALGLHERVLEGGVMELQGRASRAGIRRGAYGVLGAGGGQGQKPRGYLVV